MLANTPTKNCCQSIRNDTCLWVILHGLRQCIPHYCRTYPVMCGGNWGLVILTTHATDTGMPETRCTLQSSSLVCRLWVQPHWSTIPTTLDRLMPIWHYQTKTATRNANLLDWWSSSTRNTGCFCHISQAVTKWYDLLLMMSWSRVYYAKYSYSYVFVPLSWYNLLSFKPVNNVQSTHYWELFSSFWCYTRSNLFLI